MELGPGELVGAGEGIDFIDRARFLERVGEGAGNILDVDRLELPCTAETEKAARNEMIAALEQNGASILPDRMLPRLLKPNPNPDALARVRTMIESAGSSAAIYAVMAMRDRPDSSTLLYRVGCPTLVITGAEDVIIRVEDCRAMADAIPGSRFMRIAESGHLSNLENPEQFNRTLLEFLRR